ncbi:hypothetical protein B0H13DRAFT_1896065 [Mycena leptocephala]|nr:hypothetical protein B0H13DRAFT_1896065 [Mycena leptocephala]
MFTRALEAVARRMSEGCGHEASGRQLCKERLCGEYKGENLLAPAYVFLLNYDLHSRTKLKGCMVGKRLVFGPKRNHRQRHDPPGIKQALRLTAEMHIADARSASLAPPCAPCAPPQAEGMRGMVRWMSEGYSDVKQVAAAEILIPTWGIAGIPETPCN